MFDTTLYTDLNQTQKDYAWYVPAIGEYYASIIGLNHHTKNIPQQRIPQSISNPDVLNFLGYDPIPIFTYDWGLHSAGLTRNLGTNRPTLRNREYMFRERRTDSTLMTDSGGYQISTGKWPANWMDPNCKTADKYRENVLEWITGIGDISVSLDIPTSIINKKSAMDATNIHSLKDAYTVTAYNHDYFLANMDGSVKFLNVLQGTDHASSDHWYENMKHYSDPGKTRYFAGWALGGLNKKDLYLAMRRLCFMIHDGLLEEGYHDNVHFLGNGKLQWAIMLTAIQRIIRAEHNKNLTITFDSASPFRAASSSCVYYTSHFPDYRSKQKGKWSYRLEPTINDRKYAFDHRLWREGAIQDGIHKVFHDSPVSVNLHMSDICVYGHGSLNMQGKETSTPYDALSYALLMAHNTWHHIRAIQEANRLYDSGIYPRMLVDELSGATVTDIINEVFIEKNLSKQLKILDNYSLFLSHVFLNREPIQIESLF